MCWSPLPESREFIKLHTFLRKPEQMIALLFRYSGFVYQYFEDNPAPSPELD
jgi:hypothetical protein